MKRLLRLVAGCTLALGGIGCGGKEDTSLMPMNVGKAWTYKFRIKGIDSVGTLKVDRSLSLVGRMGYELSSPEGLSQLVWKDRELLLAAGSQGRLTPPLPLLNLDKPSTTWVGTLETIGKPAEGEATITKLKEEHKGDFRIDYRGSKYDASVYQVVIKIPRRTVVLETWFVPGIGILKQVQRTNDQLDVSIELLHED